MFWFFSLVGFWGRWDGLLHSLTFKVYLKEQKSNNTALMPSQVNSSFSDEDGEGSRK